MTTYVFLRTRHPQELKTEHSVTWYRAWFGIMRLWVQIPLLRLKTPVSYFRIKLSQIDRKKQVFYKNNLYYISLADSAAKGWGLSFLFLWYWHSTELMQPNMLKGTENWRTLNNRVTRILKDMIKEKYGIKEVSTSHREKDLLESMIWLGWANLWQLPIG